MDALTEKQQQFVKEYLVDLNATKAAVRAGYSEHTAQEQGSRLLSNVMVSQAVAAAVEARSKRVNITADEVLTELYKIATCDIRQAFDSDGRFKNVADLPEAIAKSISQIEVDELFEIIEGVKIPTGYTKKIKFWDKTRSLEMLGKHLRMFVDKIEMEVSTPLADRMKTARERAKQSLGRPTDEPETS